jgi:hypothetical protein
MRTDHDGDTEGAVAREEILMNDSRPAFRSVQKADAVITLDSQGVWISTPKSDDWLESFKAVVPWHDREWFPEKTQWYATAGYARNIIGITELFFETVQVIDLTNE